jgi:hypothetical protein
MIHTYSVYTSQEHIFMAETCQLMLCKGTVPVYGENHMESEGRVQNFDMLKLVVHTITTEV